MAKNDPGSNYTVALNLAIASRTVETYTTTALDHGLAPSCLFHVSCNAWATSFVATLQWSDDNSIWTAEADTSAGNTVSLTLLAAGSGNVSVPNPRGRYSRLSIVIGGTCSFGVTSVLGPLRSVSAG